LGFNGASGGEEWAVKDGAMDPMLLWYVIAMALWYAVLRCGGAALVRCIGAIVVADWAFFAVIYELFVLVTSLVTSGIESVIEWLSTTSVEGPR
jgi:hypothetical protein